MPLSPIRDLLSAAPGPALALAKSTYESTANSPAGADHRGMVEHVGLIEPSEQGGAKIAAAIAALALGRGAGSLVIAA